MSTAEKIIAIVAKQLRRDPAEIGLDTNLEEAGYESLDVIETIFAIEEEFDIEISFNANTDDAQQWKTVGDVVRLVEEQVAKQGGAGGAP
jgi:acyl carrier protein